jgi:hypothetical protein
MSDRRRFLKGLADRIKGANSSIRGFESPIGRKKLD